MQVAVISDIHGNGVALDAVLADLARRRVVQVVCLGDIAVGGPQPQQTVQRFQKIGCPVVSGNADAWMLELEPAETDDTRGGRIAAIGMWCAAQVAAPERAYLRSLPPTVSVDLGEGKLLLCYHGSPRSYHEGILPTTPAERLDEFISSREAAVFAGGHTHRPMLRRHGDALVVNPGSVGAAVDRDPPSPEIRNVPWAEYAIVSNEAGRLAVELCRVPLDVDALAAVVRASGMPHADWWIGNWRRCRSRAHRSV